MWPFGPQAILRWLSQEERLRKQPRREGVTVTVGSYVCSRSFTRRPPVSRRRSRYGTRQKARSTSLLGQSEYLRQPNPTSTSADATGIVLACLPLDGMKKRSPQSFGTRTLTASN